MNFKVFMLAWDGVLAGDAVAAAPVAVLSVAGLSRNHQTQRSGTPETGGRWPDVPLWLSHDGLTMRMMTDAHEDEKRCCDWQC